MANEKKEAKKSEVAQEVAKATKVVKAGEHGFKNNKKDKPALSPAVLAKMEAKAKAKKSASKEASPEQQQGEGKSE